MHEYSTKQLSGAGEGGTFCRSPAFFWYGSPPWSFALQTLAALACLGFQLQPQVGEISNLCPGSLPYTPTRKYPLGSKWGQYWFHLIWFLSLRITACFSLLSSVLRAIVLFCLILCLRQKGKCIPCYHLDPFSFWFCNFLFSRKSILEGFVMRKTVKVIFKKFLCVLENVSLAELSIY